MSAIEVFASEMHTFALVYSTLKTKGDGYILESASRLSVLRFGVLEEETATPSF